MPLTTHDSYPGVMDEFLAHWALVDDVLGGGNTLRVRVAGVPDPVGRDEFLALAGALREKGEELDRKELEGRVAWGEVALRREAALAGLRIFNDTVRVWWGARAEGSVVEALPKTGASVDKVMAAVRWGLRLWERIDAGVGGTPGGVVVPVVAGPAPGVDRGGLESRLAALGAAREGVEEAEFAAGVLRAERDGLEVTARGVMVAYGRAVPVRLGTEHALAGSVPRLSPLPGHTPKPVALRGEWRPEDAAALLEWEASDDATLEHYQIRWCPGEAYNKKEESVALTIPASGGRSALVRAGLEVPGAVACYKVYVVLKTGNERGSASVAVQAGE